MEKNYKIQWEAMRSAVVNVCKHKSIEKAWCELSENDIELLEPLERFVKMFCRTVIDSIRSM